MLENKQKFHIYTTVLRFLAFKITRNLQRIYLDIDVNTNELLLTAYYLEQPSELELELLDDIETNSDAHIPDYSVTSVIRLTKDMVADERHEYTIFAMFDEKL